MRRHDGRAPVRTLTVRRPPFSFGDLTPFIWNPDNPRFSVTGTMMSFIAPPFERYMVKATKAAVPLMRDPGIAAEAHLFMSQEAVHSRMHARHARALVDRYPGLAAIRPEVDRRFDDLFAARPLRFHLAYAADIEATFTPLFTTLLNHRRTLFDGGDSAVASLLIWHFVEEIEHRSSAIRIYDEVVGDPWYRLRMMRPVFAHMVGCVEVIMRIFDEVVPEEDRLVRATDLVGGPRSVLAGLRRRLPAGTGCGGRPAYPGQLAGIPVRDKARMVRRLVASQLPWHSPENEECPPFADHWFDEFDRGRDVADWYGQDGVLR